MCRNKKIHQVKSGKERFVERNIIRPPLLKKHMHKQTTDLISV